MTKPKSGISRRTVVKGTAWAVPAVVVATAAPAMAASPCLTASFGGNSCKQPGEGGNNKGYRLQICFKNSCASDQTILVTRVQGDQGNAPSVDVNQTITIPGNTTTADCLPQRVIYCSNSSGNFLNVYYKINGVGAELFFHVPSPVQAPDCLVDPIC